jgi:hypothetical protein
MRKIKTLALVLLLSTLVNAQTSKDSLVLKMHRTEWQRNMDSLQYFIMPAIGRAKTADQADQLQTLFGSILSRMYYRLDTIPVIKKPK